MQQFDYRRKASDRPQRLTRAEFIIVLTGAAVLTAVLAGAGYYYFSLTPDW